ncbi:MAG: winged helix DNA-binding domain-containing protein, partial [Anaerolineales bacterium]|nr:winged helix DNA-binding domain-containing protein [Anaerolineales bacterium]
MPTHQTEHQALEISKQTARRFLLLRQGLWPPRRLQGKTGVSEFIRNAGSIQFDPINIAGRNPDLVLQSRVADYRPEMLDELLYQDRELLDGWDKMASIYLADDWPHFAFRRQALLKNPDPRRPTQDVLEHVLAEIRQRGPLSSLDFEAAAQVDWYWGPTKAVRAALEHLYNQYHLG